MQHSAFHCIFAASALTAHSLRTSRVRLFPIVYREHGLSSHVLHVFFLNRFFRFVDSTKFHELCTPLSNSVSFIYDIGSVVLSLNVHGVNCAPLVLVRKADKTGMLRLSSLYAPFILHYNLKFLIL